ncbi:hypothetical protein LIA77_10734 [Sarocladium implicatum]|nr:hypothetical protein LIA77_10734 [Sarocladium implicatum]
MQYNPTRFWLLALLWISSCRGSNASHRSTSGGSSVPVVTVRADPRAVMIRFPRHTAVADPRWSPCRASATTVVMMVMMMAMVIPWRTAPRRNDLLSVVVVAFWGCTETHVG